MAAKCPFCGTEMDKRAIDITINRIRANVVIIKYNNQYKCPQHGEITHWNQSIEVNLP